MEMYLSAKNKKKAKEKEVFWRLKQREANYESQITGLKCDKECTRDVFRDENN